MCFVSSCSFCQLISSDGKRNPVDFFPSSCFLHHHLSISLHSYFRVMEMPCHLFSLTPLYTGFSKASFSMDASEENDGYSSTEDPLNSDPEDDGKKLVGQVACGSLITVLFFFYLIEIHFLKFLSQFKFKFSS